jgi:general secretion pathway protein I
MSRGDGGYTLLEMLVAFAILASVLVALYAAGGTSLRLIERGSRVSDTALLAQSKLDEIAAFRAPLPQSSKGTFPGSDVSWSMQTHELPGEGAGISPYRLQSVRLTLSWPEGADHGTLTVETRHLGMVNP